MERDRDEIMMLENRLNKLQRRFNLLSSWLQLKHSDDPSFPQSVLLNSHSQSEPELKQEVIVHEPLSKTTNLEDMKIVNIDTILAGGRRRSRKQSFESLKNTTTTEVMPCYVSVERLPTVDETPRNLQSDLETENVCSVSALADENDSDNFLATTQEDEDMDDVTYNEGGRTLLTHNPKVDRKGHPNISCHFCVKNYSIRSILQHVREQHKSRVTSDVLRGIHKAVRDSRQKYICSECDSEVPSYLDLKSHFQAFHPESYANKVENREFTDKDNKEENGGVKANVEEECNIVLNPNQVDRKGHPNISCPFCDKNYSMRSISQHVRERHKNRATSAVLEGVCRAIRNSRKKYICSECDSEASSYRDLKLHFQTFHPDSYAQKVEDGDFKANDDEECSIGRVHKQVDRKGHPTISCPFCNKNFSIRSISQHVGEQHKSIITSEVLEGIKKAIRDSRNKYICSECDSEVSSYIDLKSHYQTFHPDSYAQKVENGEFLVNDKEVVNRRSRSNDNDECNIVPNQNHKGLHYFPCPVCKKGYTRRSIYDHMRGKHKEQLTDDMLKDVRTYIQAASKLENFLFCCPACNARFKLSQFLRSHLRTTHVELYDEETIQTSDFMNSCLVTNSGEATTLQSCPTCGMVHSSFPELEKHKDEIHKGSEVLACKRCSFVTKSSNYLQIHMAIHSSSKRFKCALCPYSAKQYQGLARHKEVYHNPNRRTWQCSLCGELFKGLQLLKKHERSVHQNLRPFPCSLCGKAFKDKSNLKYHLKTHDNPTGRKRGLNKDREPRPKRRSVRPLQNYEDVM